MKRSYDTIRVGFIGTGRISDLHAIEYLNDPEGADRRAVRPLARPRQGAGEGLGAG